jgi:endonuclease/exonuclease/phosphatase family metal-dependent hydrolase
MLTRIEAAWWRWRRSFSRNEWAVRGLKLGVTADAPHAHGLLMIQIDGLAREQLERAVAKGRMPFLRRLMKRGHQLHTFYPGMPSSTPAVQAELYYGVPGAVPAFSFLDKRVGGIGMMMHPDWAKRIEADLQSQATGLLTGGSSWSNIYTGGASQQESHFCGASIGLGDMWRTGKLRTLITFAFLHFGAFARLVGLLLLEMVIGFWDAMRGVFMQGRSLKREIMFLLARVFVCVGLREMVTLGARLDVTRGLPIVHVNFLGYDEQSHRRGPDSAFAHWTLKGIDRAIRELHRAARRSGRRDYEVWIFSDHGQVRTKALGGVVEDGLEGLVRKHWPNQDAVNEAKGARPQRRPSPGHWAGGRRAEAREAMHRAESELSAFEKQEFAVAALGPVGHVYFGRELGVAETRRLAAALLREGVGGVLLRREDGRTDWMHAGGEQVLPDLPDGLPCAEPLRSEIAQDLNRLCHSPHAGDLVVLGWGTKGECWTFAQENGSHAGPTSAEAQGFALLPTNVWLPEEARHFIRPAVLRAAALRALGRSETGAVVVAPRRQPAVTSASMRVVTYNVHSCHGGDGRVSPMRIARVLERLDADVVALQELDCGRERSRSEDQLALIAERLGMHAYFCPAVTSGNSKYGHGVLSREPIRLVRRAVLPRGGRTWAEPREALWVTVPWLGQEVQLLTTHLGLGSAEQASQVADLLAPEWLGGIGTDKPVILCGDMNFPPGSPAYRKLSALMRDVQAHAPGHTAKRTFPARWPLRRIDHIFASKHFEVCGVKVLEDDLTRIASDHLPLAADLKLLAINDEAPSGGVTRTVPATAVSPGV